MTRVWSVIMQAFILVGLLVYPSGGSRVALADQQYNLVWATKASIPTDRYRVGVAAPSNGKVYAIGGTSGLVLNTVEEYDPITNTWATRASMSTARSGLGVAVASGSIYAIGGSLNDSSSYTGAVERYDPATDAWTTRANMPTPRDMLGVATASNGNIYAVGGNSTVRGFHIATVEMYDPVRDTWTTKASMPTGRSDLGVAVATNGKLYAIGGYTGSYLATVEEYDPATDTWATKESMPTPRSNLAVVAGTNGKIYAIGGRVDGTAYPVVEEYDPTTNIWISRTSMPTPRYFLGAAMATNGKIYAMGGGGGGGSPRVNEEATITEPGPNVNAGGPKTGNEGTAIRLSGTASGRDAGDAITISWTYAPVSGVDPGVYCSFSNASALNASITCTDDGAYKVTLTATDSHGASASSDAALTVDNVAPSLSITAPTMGALYAVNTSVNIWASFKDPGTNDAHSASVNWDNGNIAAGAVTESNGWGTVNSDHAFIGAGVYTIQVTLTDDDGHDSAASVMVVVYDPSAGFVTGGGWIDSPAGAYTANPSLTGRANFGFVSKYQKGANAPTGQTEFQFQVANFNFHSDSYQWLVVAGAKAQFKGTEAVNGTPGYGFLLTATDGQMPGGGGVDKFRIKIWNTATNATLYDNMLAAPDDIDTANPQAIAGGSIVIHN